MQRKENEEKKKKNKMKMKDNNDRVKFNMLFLFVTSNRIYFDSSIYKLHNFRICKVPSNFIYI